MREYLDFGLRIGWPDYSHRSVTSRHERSFDEWIASLSRSGFPWIRCVRSQFEFRSKPHILTQFASNYLIARSSPFGKIGRSEVQPSLSAQLFDVDR